MGEISTRNIMNAILYILRYISKFSVDKTLNRHDRISNSPKKTE